MIITIIESVLNVIIWTVLVVMLLDSFIRLYWQIKNRKITIK